MKCIREWEAMTERNSKVDTILYMVAAVMASAAMVGLIVELFI